MNIARITSSLVASVSSRAWRPPVTQQACCLRPAWLALPKGGIHRIEWPDGWLVVCIGGSIWLTHDGDPRDITLVAGETHLADRAGRLLVQALESAVIRVSRAGAVKP
jgi:hypothetical protein